MKTVRELVLKYWVIFLSITASLSWAFWPAIAKSFYNRSGFTTSVDMPTLGQFGDLFSPITSMFTLIALLISIYINSIQIKQFDSISKQEKLRSHTSFTQRLYSPSTLDTIYMIQYGSFSYNGIIRGNTLEQSFIDTRVPRKERDTKSSFHTESKIDTLLLTLEEYLIYLEADLVDNTLSQSIIEKITLILSDRNVNAYLDNLTEYYGSTDNTPYKRLISRK